MLRIAQKKRPVSTMMVLAAATLLAGVLPALIASPGLVRAAEGSNYPRVHYMPERMGATWRDDADGFQLQLPTHFGGIGRHGMNLATFTYSLRHWGMTVHLSLMPHPVTLQKLVHETVAMVKHDFHHAKVLRRQYLKVSGQPAAEIALQFSAISNHTPITLLRQQLIVQQTPQRFYVLTLFSPESDHATTIPLFQKVIPTFRLLNRQKIAARRIEAIAAGRHWITRQSVHKLLNRLNKIPHLYRVQMSHSDVGYVRLHAYAGRQDGFNGVFVTTNSRTFLPRGVMLLGKTVTFWAFHHQPGTRGPNLDYSTFYDEAETAVPILNQRLARLHDTRVVINPKTKKATLETIPTPFPGKEVHWQTELGVEQSGFFPILNKAGQRTGQLVDRCIIHVTRTSDAVVAGQSNKPLIFSIGPGMPAVLPPVLNYLWPRLVDLKKPRRLAFVVFDSGTGHLGLNMLQVVGKTSVNINGTPTTAYELISRLDPFTTHLWVDSDGRILKIANGDGSVWLPTTTAKMRIMWGHQLGELR